MNNIDQFVAGLNTFFIGVFVVFIMLVLLIIVISILGKVVSNIEGKGKKQVAAVQAPPVVETAKEEIAATMEVPAQDELELVAVITAVIAASMGTTSDQLQVKSLRKVQRKSL